MAFHCYENIWELTTTTGTGDIQLSGAVQGWRAVSSQYANGDTMPYSLYDSNGSFEHGIGTYNSGLNTITRTTIYRSTNSGSKVNFPAGTKNFIVSPLGANIEALLTPGSTGFFKKTADTTGSFIADPLPIANGGTAGASISSAQNNLQVPSFSGKIAPSTSYTVLSTDQGKWFANNNSTLAQTYTLPTTASVYNGFGVGFIKTGTGNVTINAASSESIFFNGTTSSSITLTNTTDMVWLINTGSTILGNGWVVFTTYSTAKVYTYNGNPNGNVAGITSVGTSAPDFVVDTSTTPPTLWQCTTTGTTSTAKWMPIIKDTTFGGHRLNTGTETSFGVVPFKGQAQWLYDTTISTFRPFFTLPAGQTNTTATIKGVANSTMANNSGTITISIATPAVVSWTGHNMPIGSQIYITTTGALPTGLNAGQTYYIMATGYTTNQFQIASSPQALGGTAINTSGTQSGVHTATSWCDYYVFEYNNSGALAFDLYPAYDTGVGISNDSTYGYITKTGDQTRALVGLATYISQAGGFIGIDNNAYTVSSYFNPQFLGLSARSLSSFTSTASSWETKTNLSGGGTLAFQFWGDGRSPFVTLDGDITSSIAGTTVSVGICVDGNPTPYKSKDYDVPWDGFKIPITLVVPFAEMTPHAGINGVHRFDIAIKVTGGATATLSNIVFKVEGAQQ